MNATTRIQNRTQPNPNGIFYLLGIFLLIPLIYVSREADIWIAQAVAQNFETNQAWFNWVNLTTKVVLGITGLGIAVKGLLDMKINQTLKSLPYIILGMAVMMAPLYNYYRSVGPAAIESLMLLKEVRVDTGRASSEEVNILEAVKKLDIKTLTSVRYAATGKNFEWTVKLLEEAGQDTSDIRKKGFLTYDNFRPRVEQARKDTVNLELMEKMIFALDKMKSFDEKQKETK